MCVLGALRAFAGLQDRKRGRRGNERRAHNQEATTTRLEWSALAHRPLTRSAGPRRFPGLGYGIKKHSVGRSLVNHLSVVPNRHHK